jgi:hypothetical protein
MLKKLLGKVLRPKNRPLGVPVLDGSDEGFEKQVMKSYNRLNDTLDKHWGTILAKAYDVLGPVVLKEKYDLELNEYFIEENTKEVISNREIIIISENINDTIVNIDQVMPYMLTSKNMKFSDVYNKYQKLQTLQNINYDMIVTINARNKQGR